MERQHVLRYYSLHDILQDISFNIYLNGPFKNCIKLDNWQSDLCGRDRMVLDLQLLMQSLPITTDVSSNLGQGEVYNIMW